MDSWSRGAWMQTYTGLQFHPLDPRREEIATEDIAHALSNICRYGGHVHKFYSVAEHSVLVSRAVPEEFALEGLLHDAAEAYIGDMVRPLKRSMADFQRIENRILRLIFLKFHVPLVHDIPILSRSVKDADNRILLDERAALMPNTKYPWEIEDLDPLGVKVMPLSPKGAEMAFMTRLWELVPELMPSE